VLRLRRAAGETGRSTRIGVTWRLLSRYMGFKSGTGSPMLSGGVQDACAIYMTLLKELGASNDTKSF
jgi:hypothetical protein